MDEHAEDPVGQASQKVVQYASLATMAAEAIAQVRQQRAAVAAATDARAVAAARGERTAALTAARRQWQPMLDSRLRDRTSVADAGLAWAAAQGWRESDPQAALASDRALERLRELRPDVMERFDRLSGDGLDPVEAMRRVAPFFDRPPARPGEHVARPALSSAPSTAQSPSQQDSLELAPAMDTSSSASRQHYIDTGEYLAAGEVYAALQAAADTAGRATDSQRGRYAERTADVDERTQAAGVADTHRRAEDSRAAALQTAAATSSYGPPSCPRTAAELAKDGFPQALTGEVLSAGRVRPTAPATTAPAAVRSAGLATAARAASRTR